MKTKAFPTQSILLALVLLTPWVARAGEITDDYATGTPLTPTLMNNIKGAVNDNDGRITTNSQSVTTLQTDVGTLQTGVTSLQTQTSNLASGCSVGQAITAVAADGTLTCTTQQTYTIYYSGSTFRKKNTSANIVETHAYLPYTWAPVAGTQYLAHELLLPQGAVVNGLTCHLYDNDAGLDITTMNQRIFEHPVTTGDFTGYFSTSSTTAGTSTAIQDFPSPADTLTIDNANNAYKIYIFDNNFGGAETLRFYGCSVTYTK